MPAQACNSVELAGLLNYQESFHVTRNLPACVELIEQFVDAGLQRLVVAGTCYEYGLQNGSLTEDQFWRPLNCYAIAKDSLRRVIASRFSQQGLQWCWARIFYPFGHGQNPKSFLPSLQRAIDQRDPEFAMSSGRQVRDFVPVALPNYCCIFLCIQRPKAYTIVVQDIRFHYGISRKPHRRISRKLL